ncbi:MAG: hypothetical protein GX610_00935 [Rhodococcus sp.]|nr:hypothetical protein [Rhodococcus sp. (in: high G+C Gram-positive bacteria)]
MTMDEIIDFVNELESVLTLQPQPGDGTPEISWGDTFFYYSPDGVVPTTGQPFATIVTKEYPGEERSGLDRAGAFRVNVASGKEAFVRWTARQPRDCAGIAAPGVPDTVLPHPVYGSAGWLAVLSPGTNTDDVVQELLFSAYRLARTRLERKR